MIPKERNSLKSNSTVSKHSLLFLGSLMICVLLQFYRHANISLEMLLKLVAVFGPVVRSTISAPPAVGVDLHAEQRFNLFSGSS